MIKGYFVGNLFNVKPSYQLFHQLHENGCCNATLSTHSNKYSRKHLKICNSLVIVIKTH